MFGKSAKGSFSIASLFVAVAFLAVGSVSLAETAPVSTATSSLSETTVAANTSATSLTEILNTFKTDKKGHSQFYSESFYSYDFGFVTDSRLRYLQPVIDKADVMTEAYVAASVQYQSAGAREQMLENNINPAIGLKTIFFKKLGFVVQTGYKTYTDENHEGTRSVWDPKAVLATEIIHQWDNPRYFSEGSFEIDYAPRLDSSSVASILSLKQGLRFKPVSSVNFDTLGEVYRLDCRNTNYGVADSEYRLGVRSTWESKSWNVAATLFHAYDRADARGDVDGLLTVEGQF